MTRGARVRRSRQSDLFRGLNWLMCALFLLAVLVQWNDPDPARWVGMYSAAFLVCLTASAGWRMPSLAPLLVLAIAVVWGLSIVGTGPAVSAYAHIFDAWQMSSTPVEEAREGAGLLIVAMWMLVVAVTRRPARING
jgi:Transmembrane family 220, helix